MEFTTLRQGNLFIVYAPETGDRVFWQIEQGARKRVPAASGIWDTASAEAHCADRIAAGFVKVANR